MTGADASFTDPETGEAYSEFSLSIPGELLNANGDLVGDLMLPDSLRRGGQDPGYRHDGRERRSVEDRGQ